MAGMEGIALLYINNPHPQAPLPTIKTSTLSREPSKEDDQVNHSNGALDPYAPNHAISRDSVSGSLSKTPSSSSSNKTFKSSSDYINDPFMMRHGRRYHRDQSIPYPLPCDLAEIHRQSLRTSMLIRSFGAPFCNPTFHDKAPTKVLDLGCGSGLWSAACHDYFKHLGYPNVSFTGMDCVPIAPDLNKQGVDWTFVQGDVAKLPLPFADASFDFVFIKDVTQYSDTSWLQGCGFEEPLRLLKPGGVLELWDSDYVFRTLLPYPPIAPGVKEDDVEQAEKTGTYTIFPGTPFAPAQNKYLQDYNRWVQLAFEKRQLTAVPCAQVYATLSLETEACSDFGTRRIAIPLSDVRWEREGIGGKAISAACKESKEKKRRPSSSHLLKVTRSPSVQESTKALTTEQAALRKTALVTVVQMIEAFEPMLQEASGKNQDEWDRWWAGMMADLMEHNGTASGECLEVGTWWAHKKE
ncbi:MAG: hypothetical protein M1834_008050 [Cirrosporium novae-zelandiae]|nr:MAG: hypothetical protein M1834_008050 [Cirrosporium novae-zelandiae]